MVEYPLGCVNEAGKTLPKFKPDTRIAKLWQEFVLKKPPKTLHNSEEKKKPHFNSNTICVSA